VTVVDPFHLLPDLQKFKRAEHGLEPRVRILGGRRHRVVLLRSNGKDVMLSTSTGDVPIQQYEGDYSALQ